MMLFRADGNGEIGSGHIMRCLSIADAGRSDFGQDVLFALAGDDFREMIKKRGYPCLVWNTDYRDMEAETQRMEELVHVRRPSALFVDSYYAGFRYLGALKRAAESAGGALAYLDDVMSYAYPCHLLVNYNIYGPDERDRYAKLYRQAGVPLPRLALGAAFAPLREEFQNLPARAVERDAKDILISTGGADSRHLALSLARYLAGSMGRPGGERFDGFRFHFIIGAMNRDYETIETIAKGCEAIFLHVNVTDMARLMREADVAISAAGSTLYELCAAQTPAITYILADNQIPGARGFERHRILDCAGDVREMTDEEAAKKLLERAVELAGDFQRRKAVSGRQREVVDAGGARRIAGAALELASSCKKSAWDDE